MTVTYHEHDHRQHVTQPQLTRTRHRYRGPRESYRVNLEMAQFQMDVRRLYQRVVSQEDTFRAHVDVALAGGTLVPGEPVLGLEALAHRTQALLDRVRRLQISSVPNEELGFGEGGFGEGGFGE